MIFKAAIFLLGLSPSWVMAEEAKIFDHFLGDHIVDFPVDTAEVLDSDIDGYAGQSFIRIMAPEATEIALTFQASSRKLHYIEHDWIDRSKTASTALDLTNTPEFQFGKAKISDVQSALGSEGFHYACRRIVRTSDGFVSFLSFEIPSRPEAVYTFVFEHSPDLIERGWVEPASEDFGGAILVATIVFRPHYGEQFWCPERVAYDPKSKLPLPPEQQRFSDFLPNGLEEVETDPWSVITEPVLMIAKNGAVTWGDRMHIMPDPVDCANADVMVWAHTVQDKDLLKLKRQAVDAAFNLLLLDGVHAPVEAPMTLSHAIYAPIDGREWPPFAIGSFVFGPFDFKTLAEAENDPDVFGFSLEFGSDVAGMRDNFWSLEGLSKAGAEAIRLCQEKDK